MSRWRKRIGKEVVQFILKLTVLTGLESEVVNEFSLERVTVDTTVQPKALAFPTDSKLYNRSRERLVRLAQQYDIPLRQSYARLGPRALLKAGRYLHARQRKRANREIKRLKTFLGRMYRDISRKLEQHEDVRFLFEDELAMAEQLLAQERKSKNKLYSLHTPEVECISKGKAHKKYEYGVKVSVATTNRDNFVVGMFAEHGNLYDGHTLVKAQQQIREITGKVIKRCYVDRGYRGHGIQDTEIFISGGDEPDPHWDGEVIITLSELAEFFYHFNPCFHLAKMIEYLHGWLFVLAEYLSQCFCFISSKGFACCEICIYSVCYLNLAAFA